MRIIREAGSRLGDGSGLYKERDVIIRGNLLSILEEAKEKLRSGLARTGSHPGGSFEVADVYPEKAWMEALVNAVAHRDYSVEDRPIECRMFDDGLEFRSPGGLLSTIPVKELKDMRGVHQSRNPYVGRVLRETGYIWELGEGIPRIFREMSQRGLPKPTMTSTPTTFTLTLRQATTRSR